MIEVVYAEETKLFRKTVTYQAPMRIQDALDKSDAWRELQIEAKQLSVGVFGQVKQLDHLLQDGDRVEIYRRLKVDPKTKRKLLLKAKKS